MITIFRAAAALLLQDQPAEVEETTGATPWQAQIYSGHPLWTQGHQKAGATAGTSPINAAAR